MSAPAASDLHPNGQPRSGGRSVPLLGFRAPEEETTPNPATTFPPEEELGLEQDSGLDYDEASDPTESPAGTSSPGSTRAANPLAGVGLRDTFRNGVILASHQAHTYLARTQGKLETQLYLADEDDAANIGDPLARFVGRREGLGEVSPDTADLLAAMMGLAGYASKQIQRSAIAAKIDARAGDVQHLPEPGDLA